VVKQKNPGGWLTRTDSDPPVSADAIILCLFELLPRAYFQLSSLPRPSMNLRWRLVIGGG
jgi:hypothetical protein